MALDIKAILAKKEAEKKAASQPAPIPAMPMLDIDSMTIDITEDYVSNALGILTGNAIPVVLEEGEIDPRVKLLSHSSRVLLHTCPRKYQLYRLNGRKEEDERTKTESEVTFAFGHAVGIGIQSTLEGKTYNQIMIDTFLGWDTDLLNQTPRQVKSFWLAVHAVERLHAILSAGELEDWELVYYQGKPAVELSFLIKLPNGFKYRGYVDAVLRHKVTGEIRVLEVKTSSGRAEVANYKNSGQAVGYSVVLDIMFPELSSYEVLYLVYETKSFEYVQLPFNKSLFQRALWLQELIIDCKQIELYESFDVYPMHGESCYDFFRDCDYLSTCVMDTDKLTQVLTQEWIDKEEAENEKFQFKVSFEELVQKQIEKGG